MSKFLNHQRDGSAVTKDNVFTGKHSNISKNTTKGLQVLVEWKEETTPWVDIKDIKQAILIYLVEYVAENHISDKP